MTRSPKTSSDHPAVVVINPDDEVTPAAFFAWLDEVETAETSTEAQAAGEV